MTNLGPYALVGNLKQFFDVDMIRYRPAILQSLNAWGASAIGLRVGDGVLMRRCDDGTEEEGIVVSREMSMSISSEWVRGRSLC